MHDVTHWESGQQWGIFIVHSLKKFDPSWQEWLMSIGLPPEMQLPIALAELIGGICLVVGVLTRVAASIMAVILLGAIFHIRWENGFFVSDGGWEWDLIMLAAVLTIIVAGPGRISISHVAKRYLDSYSDYFIFLFNSVMNFFILGFGIMHHMLYHVHHQNHQG